jgi:hypothetical protein
MTYRGMGIRPNGPREPSPGLRPQADALGLQAPQPCGLKGLRDLNRKPSRLQLNLSRTFQAAVMNRLSTQGIGLRPQSWAPFCRPVGPMGRVEEAAEAGSVRVHLKAIGRRGIPSAIL